MNKIKLSEYMTKEEYDKFVDGIVERLIRGGYR